MVVVTGRYRATVRSTGAEIDTPIAHLFTVRNGKIEKWVGFSDSAQVADRTPGKRLRPAESRASYCCAAAFCWRAKKSNIAAKAGAATLVWLPPGTST